MSVDAPPPEPESAPLRVLFALGVIALFHWSLFAAVSTATTAEIEAQRNLHVLIERAQKAMREQRFEDALPPLEELTRLQPRNHVYWWERAVVCSALHRPRDEIGALEAFVKVSPLPSEACPRLGFLYRDLGMAQESLDALKRCAEFSPRVLENIFHYGHALEMNGQLDAALAVYEEALKTDTNADIEAGMGRILLRKGAPAEAYERVRPVLARNPNNVDALLVAGLAQMRQNHLADAQTLLERGVARHDDADFRYALGLIAEIERRPNDALAEYDIALKLDPNHVDAKTRRALLVSATYKAASSGAR